MNFINIQLFVIAMLPLHTTLLFAQTPIAISLQLENDTASSVFAQDYCRISYLTSEMDTIISSRRHTQLQARFAGSSWKNITLPLNSSDPTLIVSGNVRFLINLLPFFWDDDSLFMQLSTNDFFIELRVSIFAIVNDVAGYNFNSNIAKLHLKANQDDILAFLYLKEHNIDPVSFSWLWNWEGELSSDYKFIRDHFADSVISDMARHLQLHEFSCALVGPPPTLEERQYVKAQYLLLKNSKSAYVRLRADDFYSKYIKE